MSNFQAKYEKCLVTVQNLYNFEVKIIHKKLKEQSLIQILLNEIKTDSESDILSEKRVDEKN